MKKRVLVLTLVLISVLLTCMLAACAGGSAGRCPDGHTWQEDEVISAPTCTEAGKRYEKCSVCGIKREVEIEALGHSLAEVPGTAFSATCENDGNTGKLDCIREGCNYFENGTTIPAIGHAYGDWISNGDGTHKKVCENDAEHQLSGDCSGGTATCMHKAVCTTCQGEYGQLSADHTYDKQVVDPAFLSTPATCSTKATYFYSCECGAKGTQTFEVDGYADHAYIEQIATETYKASDATCTQKATYYFSCACGAIGTDTFEHGETTLHNFNNEVATDAYKATDATCTAKATYYYSCDCGAHGSATFASGDLLPHTYTIMVAESTYIATSATCQKLATYYKSCTCGDFDPAVSDTFEAGVYGPHVYDKEIAEDKYWISDATCTDPATYYKSCVCGEKGAETFEYGNTIPHTYDQQIVSADHLKFEANCSSAAEYYYSCKCGANGTETFRYGAPTGLHVYDREVVKDEYKKSDATCTAKAVYYKSCECNECDKEVSPTFETGEMLDHVSTHHEAVDATCISKGNIEYWSCSSCGKNYDAEQDGAVIEDITTAIDDENHTHTAKIADAVAPGCESDGYTAGLKCTDCNDVLEEIKIVFALGHDWDNGTVTTDPTCTTLGVKTFDCSRCDDTKTEDVDKLPHTEETIPAVESTCCTTGLTEGTKCSVCKTVLVEQEETEKKSHTYDAGVVTTEPTCTDPGVKTFTCTTCTADPKASYTEEVPATGHAPVKNVCECGKEYTTQDIVALVNGLDKNEALPGTYMLSGTIVSVDTPYDAGKDYVTVTIAVDDAELELQCYRLTGEYADIIGVGDSITVSGVLKNYYSSWNDTSTLEFDSGCIIESHTLCDVTVYLETFGAGTVAGIPADKITRLDLVNLTITPATGYEIEEILVNDQAIEGTDGAYTFVATEDSLVQVNFKKSGVADPEIKTTFEFGEDKATGHNDGTAMNTETSVFEQDGYTLTFTNFTNVYANAKDETGKSAVKLGASKKAASFTFTVPDEITKVYINVAGYKNNTAKLKVTCGTDVQSYTVGSPEISNSGLYTELLVDTSNVKTITVETLSGGYRAMIDSIVFSRENPAAEVCIHEFGEYVETTPATCLERGIETSTCSLCDEIKTRQIDALGHDMQAVEAKAPTCTEKGYTAHSACSRCDHTDGYESVEKVAHTYVYHNAVAETCQTAGNHEYYTCENCSTYFDTDKNVTTLETLTIAKDPAKHTLATGEAQEHSCTQDGWATFEYCTVEGCDHTTKEVVLASHNFGEWIDEIPATCIATGEKGHKVCSYCTGNFDVEGNKIDDLTIAIDEDAHDMSVSVEAKAHTCTEDGYSAHTMCSRCDHTEGKVVDAAAHTLTPVDAQTPTCTEVGWNAYEYCTKCDHTTYVEIPALKHDYVSVVTDPTCTTNGYTTHTCSRCGDSYVDSEVAQKGHDYDDGVVTTEPTCTEKGTKTFTCKNDSTHTYTEEVAAKGHSYATTVTAPTCTEKGYTTYTCSTCSDTYKDDYVDATGHKYTSVVTAPTCTAEGYTTYKCSCGDSYVDNYVDMTAHEYDDGVVTKDPTCTEEGEKKFTCADCGGTKLETIAAAGHDYETVVTDPTCTQAGYTTYTCHCGDTYTADEVEKLGHTFTNYKEVAAPTCTEVGSETSKCDRCDETDTREIKALGHVDEDGNNSCDRCSTSLCLEHFYNLESPTSAYHAADATCTEPAKYFYSCICGMKGEETFSYGESLGHDHKAVVTDPTCTQAGYTTYTCSRCSDTYIDNEVEALGHTEEIISGKAATCTETGLTEGKKCSVCGEILVEQETTEALGHDYTSEVTTAPTCTATGVKTFTCKNDPSHIYTETISATGHDYTHVVTAPTCTERGYTTHTCSKCNDSYVDSYVDATGHTIEQVNAKEATCTEAGHNAYEYCTKCDHSTFEEVSATGHDFEGATLVPEVPATCTSTGTAAYQVCNTCQEKCDALGGKYETIILPVDPDNHVWDDGEVTTPATCTTEGEKTFHCTLCDAGVKTEAVEALGHNLVDVAGLSATCVAPGYTAHKDCSRCDYTEGKEVIGIDSTAHAYSDWNDEIPAKCNENGQKGHFTCENEGCDKVFDSAYAVIADLTIVDEDAHKFGVEVEGKAATCVATGLTAHKDCEYCHKHFSLDGSTVIEETVIAVDPNAHNFDSNNICANEDSENNVCGAERMSAVVAIFTFGENGGTANEESNQSTTSYSETQGAYTLSITEGEQMYTDCYDGLGNSIIKLGSSKKVGSFSFVVPEGVTKVVFYVAGRQGKEANVTINGTNYDDIAESSSDGAYRRIEVVVPENRTITFATQSVSEKRAVIGTIEFCSDTVCKHVWDEGVVTTDPTCTEKGIKTYTCSSTCGGTKTEPIDKLGHKLNEVTAVASTCKVNGTLAHFHCDTCGKNYTTNQADVELESTVAPLDEDNHVNVVTDKAKTPTCTVTGLTEGRHCADCDKVLVEQEIISVVPHADTNNDNNCDVCGTSICEHTQNADGCIEDGAQHYYVCSKCEQAYGHEGHTYNKEVVDVKYLKSDATCTVAATYYKSCECGAVGTETFTTGKLLDHNYNQEVAEESFLKTPATCQSAAVYYKSCTCGKVGTETFTSGENVDHDFVDVNGDKSSYACSGCGWAYNIATSLAVGDMVIFTSTDKSVEMGAQDGDFFSSVGYSFGTSTQIVLTVCAGSSDGTFAFKTSSGDYLHWSSGNSLATNANLTAKSSWVVTFSSGNADIQNASVTSGIRHIVYNASSPRFACYTTTQTPIQIYKVIKPACTTHTESTDYLSDGTNHWKSCAECGAIIDGSVEEHTANGEGAIVAPTCTEDGYTQHSCLVCGGTYKMDTVTATGHDAGAYVNTNATQHWKECTKCDEELEGTREDHPYVDGICACGAEEPSGGETLTEKTYTYTFSNLGYDNATAVTTVSNNENGVTIEFSKGNGKTAPTYYASGTAIRTYADNTFTVSAGGQRITKIVITYVSDQYVGGSYSADVGTYGVDGKIGTWTGDSAEIVFTKDSTTTQGRIVSILVTYLE